MDLPLAALKALADPTRLAILDFLRHPLPDACRLEDMVCACDLEAWLGITQPAVSHHMKILVQAGLVTAQKQGKWTYYEVQPDTFDQLIRFLEPYRVPVQASATSSVTPQERP